MTRTWQRAKHLWRITVQPPWRDPLIATISFVLGALYYATGLHETLWRDGRAAPIWASLLVLFGLCGADLIRSRAPRVALPVGLAIFLVGAVLVETSLPAVLILLDLLYAAVLHGPRRYSRVLVGIVSGLVPIATIVAYVQTGDWRVTVTVFLAVMGLPVISVWWGMQVRLHREVAESERARAEQVARLADVDRRAAVSAERARMARDLHDAVAGHLSAIAIQSEAALAVRTDDSTLHNVLTSVRENSVQALTEMRAMIGLLRQDESDSRTVPARLHDLETLVESARAGGVPLRVMVDPLPGLPTVVDLAAYRILQEALTNLVKHACGETATLTVTSADSALILYVENRLQARVSSTNHGVEGESLSGVGLVNMRERARAVGGLLTITNGGDSWRVHAQLPLEPAILEVS